jgi:outer membrane protein, heavy metal efflux system
VSKTLPAKLGLVSVVVMLVSASPPVCARASAQTPTHAPPMALTLDQAIARAREQAPRVLVARARIDEVAGKLAGARVRLQNNPVVDANAGHRSLGGDRGEAMTDFDVGISQTFELGNRRAARIAGAEAVIARETAQADDATRAIVQEAAEAFFRAVFAREQLALLTEAERVAQEVARVAQRRYEAGDIAILDVNLAKADASRAAARTRIARAAQQDAWGDLRRLLGLGGAGAGRAADADGAIGAAAAAATSAAMTRLATKAAIDVNSDIDISADIAIDVQGELRRPSTYALADLLARADTRPELRVLDAEAEEGEANARLGRGLTRPDFGLGVRYGRDAGDRVVMGGFSITLPVFSRGQELQATGSARARRARLERQTVRDAIAQDVRTAFAVYQEHRQAVDLLERDTLPGLAENEALARRSFDVGQISLPDLLVIRREILGTRLDHLDEQLAATIAGLRQEFAAGVLP